MHFKQSALDWIAAEHNKFDAVCLTGDFLNTSDNAPVPLAEQVAQLQQWLSILHKPVFVCSGNHDVWKKSFSWLKSMNPNVVADGQIVELNGVTFGCIGYQQHNYANFANCDVILHHEPPARTSPAKQAGVDYGSEELYWALKTQVIQPKYLLCGHVHKPQKHVARFKQTIISNAGGVHNNAGTSYAVVEISSNKEKLK